MKIHEQNSYRMVTKEVYTVFNHNYVRLYLIVVPLVAFIATHSMIPFIILIFPGISYIFYCVNQWGELRSFITRPFIIIDKTRKTITFRGQELFPRERIEPFSRVFRVLVAKREGETWFAGGVGGGWTQKYTYWQMYTEIPEYKTTIVAGSHQQYRKRVIFAESEDERTLVQLASEINEFISIKKA